METSLPRKDPGRFGRRRIDLGERAELSLAAPAGPLGGSPRLPLTVWRGPFEGPCVAVFAGVHGDEIGPIATLRTLLRERPFELSRGTLLVVPVANTGAFERGSRYSPDRRDLNRCFPGRLHGSPSARLARLLFREVVARADVCIDLHSAAAPRHNYPHLRVDAQHPESLALAQAFGARWIVHHRGTAGSLRRVAQASGRPSLVAEAGGPGRAEPAVVQWLLRGLQRLLVGYGLLPGPAAPAAPALLLRRTRWLRARRGGLLEYYARLGERVPGGRLLLGATTVLGRELERLHAPAEGVVLGLCTQPAIGPGDALLHLALLDPEDARRHPPGPVCDPLEQQLDLELNGALRILSVPPA
jgi:predicted deacylase